MNVWRDVTESVLRAGCGSVLGPDTRRRTRWWDLRLECGHHVERHVRYRKLDSPARQGTRRAAADVLPPVARVACRECARLALKEMFS